MDNSIGGLESSSMAKGYDISDAMLKTSKIRLLLSRTICPGKFMILIAGSVADVDAAVKAGIERAAESLVDSFVIPNIHPDIFPAIEGTSQVGELEALGILETFSVASTIEAADAAVKAANVKPIELKLAMAMGGKGMATFTGSVAAITAAIEAGAFNAGMKGMLVHKTVIPQPRKELLSDII
ncbi:MAG: propanediol utilization protein [Elusimicrobia bacterium CG_4_9_14_3_um_filter_62_55]|nr:MAG: propanediol utilization protein [Elusimicrobia bacterium CG22_combo_CG10-13_8_21_14_all_63_91]PJA15801.1 MAG: propanediol utilization protein [Elusimicrobia bacterium CG_4_10_14_0_2_um_filter_63_34]PJB24893.1 MAG: propanediol utilization protein [Elusimicrobia bacterium CG_4_9_14_3_um_filter_62_55]